MSVTDFDPDLIRQHDVNGPRYTSYPTANHLEDGDWSDTYKNSLSASDIGALSLYMHVPFCSTICFYCACNKINTANVKHADRYVKRLIREMALHSSLLDRRHKVEQLHFGGGTPTFLSDEQFRQVFDALHNHFNISKVGARDFSIEIDPRNLSASRINNLAEHGINRVSIGVQDFDAAVQRAVNRIQTFEETRNVVDAARTSGIHSINIDLINGLPKQSLTGFALTLKKVIALEPDRLSLYSYAHLPRQFKTQMQIFEGDLPDAELKLKLLETAVRMLGEAGYEYIGMDHFAKSSDSLVKARRTGNLHRNFQGYATHGHCELIGLGVSSIGQVGRIIVQNSKNLRDYYQSIDSGELAIVRGLESSNRDVVVGQVIQDLMCNFEVDLARFSAVNGIDFSEYFARQWRQLMRLESQRLVKLTPHRLIVTRQGRFLIRNICMTFDTYLDGDTGKYSKAI